MPGVSHHNNFGQFHPPPSDNAQSSSVQAFVALRWGGSRIAKKSAEDFFSHVFCLPSWLKGCTRIKFAGNNVEGEKNLQDLQGQCVLFVPH